MASWLVADSLSAPEQWFGSHLSAYSNALREAEETVDTYCLNIPRGPWTLHEGAALKDFDFLLAMDQYERCGGWPLGGTTKIALVASVHPVMPWDVKGDDGKPAFQAVVSSIPWMVQAAQDAGLVGLYQPLAFDARVLACADGVKRDIDVLFVGTRDSNHRMREVVLRGGEGYVTVLPPCYGEDYYRTIARARVLLHVHAEWSRGAANALRLYEGAGLQAAVVSDGYWHCADKYGEPWWDSADGQGWAQAIKNALAVTDDERRERQTRILAEHGYRDRIIGLKWLARSL